MQEEIPLAEIKSDSSFIRKVVLSLAVLGAAIAGVLYALLPPLYATAGLAAYLMTVGYGLYALKQLDLKVVVYRDRIVVRKGYSVFDLPFNKIRSITIEPRVVSISLTPMPTPGRSPVELKLPKIVASTYIVRIVTVDGEEVTFQLFKDEQELFIKALSRARQLGGRVPYVEVF